MMRNVVGLLMALAVVVSLAIYTGRPVPADAQGGGTIEAEVKYNGAPMIEKIKVNKDTEKCGTEA